MNKTVSHTLLAVALLMWGLSTTQCTVSFKGISIPPEMLTFYVEDFRNTSTQQVPGLEQEFTQRLRDKIRTESRLVWSDVNPDAEFSGRITNFVVNDLAPQEGATTALSELVIYVKVDYVNHQNPTKNNFSKTFNFGIEFSSEQNLLDIQDDLIDQIFTQLTEEIFNQAFTNW